jgi:hypothetical protein
LIWLIVEYLLSFMSFYSQVSRAPSSRRRQAHSNTSQRRLTFNILCLLNLYSFQPYAQAANAQASSCLALQGSETCPGFQDNQIDRSLQTLAFLADVSTVKAFDEAFEEYLSSGFLKAKLRDEYGCNSTGSFSLDETTRDLLSLRYQKTIWCASIVHQSAQNCAPEGSREVQTACAGTCLGYALSIADIMESPICSDMSLSDANLEKLRHEYEMCASPGIAYAESRCVEGALAEGRHCGFNKNDGAYCRHCARLQGQSNGTADSLEGCCADATEKYCAAYDLNDVLAGNMSQVIVSLGKPNVTAPVILQETKTHRLSPAVLAGTIVPSVLAALAVSLCICLLSRRRQQEASKVNRLRTLNALDSRDGSSRPREIRRTAEVTMPTAGSSISAHSAMSALSSIGQVYPDSKAISGSDLRLSGLYGRQKTHDVEKDGPPGGHSVESLVLVDQWSGQQLRSGKLVRCLRAYVPQLPDELALQVNDLIRIDELFADRWAKGRLIRNLDDETELVTSLDEQKSPAKVFPLVCVCAAEYTDPANSHISLESASGSSLISGQKDTQVQVHTQEKLSQEDLASPISTIRQSNQADAAGETSSIGGSTCGASSIVATGVQSPRHIQPRTHPTGLHQVTFFTHRSQSVGSTHKLRREQLSSDSKSDREDPSAVRGCSGFSLHRTAWQCIEQVVD